MKDQLQKINQRARELNDLTKDKSTISRKYHKLLQDILDEMQDELDTIANELQRAEMEK